MKIKLTDRDIKRIIKEVLKENKTLVSDDDIGKKLINMGFKIKKLENFTQYDYRSRLKDCNNNTPKTLQVIQNKNDRKWWIQYGVCDTVFKKEKLFDTPKYEIISKVEEIKKKFK
jgi:hypothetical protein